MRQARLAVGIAAGLALAGLTLGVDSRASAAVSTPTFTSLTAPALLPNSDSAGEPSLGVDGRTGALMYQSFTSTYRVVVNASGKATWTNVTPPTSLVNLDPILATDRVTGRTIAGGLLGECSLLSYSDDDGASWQQMTNACTGPFDHETIGSGPWREGGPLLGTYPRAVYYCAQLVLDACATSSNGGLTFGAPTPLTGVCRGLHGHVKVGRDGTAYLPHAHCGGLAGGGVTTNNGLTWTSYTIPGSSEPADGFDPSIATTPDNTVYESWQGANNHAYVSRSRNHAVSWSKPFDLGMSVTPHVVTSTFHAAVAGDDGRAAVAFLGSTTGGNAFESRWRGVWDLYVAYTYDGGATWKTVKASPDPVQRGWMCASGTTCSTGRNLDDFLDVNLTKDGRVVVGFADGCIKICAGEDGLAAQSVNAWATIAYQRTGKGLLAAYDRRKS
jgi:hypothetical protein